MTETFSLLVLLPFPFALLWAMVSDVRSLEIPNAIPLFLLAAYLIAALVHGVEGLIVLRQIGVGFGVLLIGAVLFAFGVVGGGDVKLLAACMPWLTLGQIPSFLFMMALIGGLVSVAMLGLKRLPIQGKWLAHLRSREKNVPYGLAIGGAGLILTPSLSFVGN